MTTQVAIAGTGEIVDLTGVHPVAELFPMLAGEELEELATSIADRGQEQPIIIDKAGVLLDGRNRLSACDKARIMATATYYDGNDPDGYALTVNITRRHMTTGARAIITASAARLNGQQGKVAAAIADMQSAQVSRANVILDWANDLVPGIMLGEAFSVAYDVATGRKADAAKLDAQLSRLAENAPDLRGLVDEQRMSVADALAALDARITKAQREDHEKAEEVARRQRVATNLLCQNVVTLAQIQGTTTAEDYNPDDALPGRAVTRDVITSAIRALDEMMTIWKAEKRK